jgi:hypothetical protein
MPRYIIVTVGCDWTECTTEGPEGGDVVTELTVALDGKPGRTFLLCKTHREQLDEIVLPLMQKGIKVEAPSRRNGSSRSTPAPIPGTPEADSLVCKAEGCNRNGRPVHNRTGMAQHVIRSHDFASLADYEAVHGAVIAPSASSTIT